MTGRFHRRVLYSVDLADAGYGCAVKNGSHLSVRARGAWHLSDQVMLDDTRLVMLEKQPIRTGGCAVMAAERMSGLTSAV